MVADPNELPLNLVQYGASAAGVLVLGCIGVDSAGGFKGTPRGLADSAASA